MHEDDEDKASLDVEDRFAIVPEWLLDADISDSAVRLYAVLLRFGQTSGARMPARSTLASRMRKKSTDTIDRAMRELVDLGAVVVQNRFDGGQRLTNKYLVRTGRPRSGGESGGSRKNAATPMVAASRTGAATRNASGEGGRISAARVAANLRHNPESFTHSKNPPPPTATLPTTEPTRRMSWAEEADRLLAECGISDWDAFVADCQALRRQLGQPVARWSGHCLLAAIQLAVRNRGWSPARAAVALRAVAADPTTRSPMRLAEAGPWWDEPAATTVVSGSDVADLAAMEADLADAGGLRPLLQRQAREQLATEGIPVTRATVTRRARAAVRAARRRHWGRGMLSDRAARAVNRGTTCGVVGLTVAGFAMSYDALHSLAVDQGVPAPLAWLWPLVVDGFIVVASLSVVRAVAAGRRATYPWVLVLTFSGISVAFNVVHAAPTLVARLVAAIPPAALVLSFELLMRQLRGARRPTNPAVTPAVIAPEPQCDLPASNPRSRLLERARDIHAAHRLANQRITGTVLARELAVSEGYGRRLLRQLANNGGGAA